MGKLHWISFCLGISTCLGIAQTAVTTNIGTLTKVPKFSGDSMLSKSVVTEMNGNLGISTMSQLQNIQADVSSGAYLLASPAVPLTSQGPYVTWNAMTGGTGETDFINNEGTGSGGFAFMNTPGSGGPAQTLMFVNGLGNVGIGTIPNAWGGSYPGNVLQVGSAGFEGTPGYNILSQNTYFDGSNWRYSGNGTAQLTYFSNGNWYWQSAAPGTLGETATLSTPMALVGGSLGIGTTTPRAKLEIAGSVKLSGAGSSITFPNGDIQSIAWNGTLCGGDYAESVDVSGDRTHYEPGDVLVIDPAQPGKFLKSNETYSTSVTGVYSTKPGVVGRRQDGAKSDLEVPMAMIGIVPVKVSTENGSIKPGDFLVTASTPGYAMKGTDRERMFGAVVGKALGNLESDRGVIEAVISLQ